VSRRLSLAKKFFVAHLAIAGIALSVAGGAGYFLVRNLVMSDADELLVSKARQAAEAFRPLLSASKPDRDRIAREGDRLGREFSARMTVVLPDGTVVADSSVGAGGVAGMENLSRHLEIREALSGAPGFSHRRSVTIREERRYAALPVVADGRIVGVVRTSVSAETPYRRLRQILAIVWGTGIGALLLILGGAAFMAGRVTGPLAEMQSAAREMGAGNLSRRVQLRTGDELEDMAGAMNRMASQLSETIAQLDAGKARLETLLANLSDGVIVVTPARTVRMMNREAGEILNASETMGEGRPYIAVIRHPQVLAFIDAWSKGSGSAPAEITLSTLRGTRVVRMSGTMVRYRDESEPDILITLLDTTEEKRLARMKSEFVSNASHELRTPLTNIRGYLEAIQDAVRDGASPDPAFLETAHVNALRMERLIDDLLELSRAESGAAPIATEETSIAAFLSRIAEIHRPSAERAGKTIPVEAGDGMFRADLRKLTLAVSNLVDNAIKYGKEGGRIELSGRVEGDGCLLEVADDGPGIEAEHLPRIFERFYRIDKGRSRELGGTGLGLSIARHVVESHGGSIRVESRPGRGTRFAIRIPL